MLYSKILGFVMKGRIRKRSDFHEAFIWEVKCWQFMKSQKNTGRHCWLLKEKRLGVIFFVTVVLGIFSFSVIELINLLIINKIIRRRTCVTKQTV